MAGLGHFAVGLAAARLWKGVAPPDQDTFKPRMRASFLFVSLSMLPDADIVSFMVGIPYSDQFGHRGASHSLVFAAAVGVITALVARTAPGKRGWLGLLAALVVASHGLLDTLTDGGLGVALFWPFENARHFAPWRPIPVSPIGREMIGARGLTVMATELLFFAPLLVWTFWPRARART